MCPFYDTNIIEMGLILLKSTVLPVDARPVVSRVLSEDGEILAEWLLLSNVKATSAGTLALWYCWRWQIECFFKGCDLNFMTT